MSDPRNIIETFLLIEKCLINATTGPKCTLACLCGITVFLNLKLCKFNPQLSLSSSEWQDTEKAGVKLAKKC